MTVKLLQWNIDYREDVTRIAEFIRASGAEIICLQELTLGYRTDASDVGAFMAEKLGFQSYVAYGPMVLPSGEAAQVGMGIFSKFQITDGIKLVVQDGKIEVEKIVQDERFYIQAQAAINGKSVTIGTAHLPFHPRFQTTPRKQAMVETIVAQRPVAGNYIFAGDLNVTPGTKAAKAMRAGLRHAGPALAQPSWTTKPFRIRDLSYTERRWRLDYVLYRGEMGVKRAELVETDLSDHLPILVEFEL